MRDVKFDFNDITLVPAVLSDIRSRSEVDCYYDSRFFRKHLPLIVAPMDSVINDDNAFELGYKHLLTCSIRREKPEFTARYNFISLSLDQFIALDNVAPLTCLGILIDIANAHMQQLYDAVKSFKAVNPGFSLMIGNIANPLTYAKYCEILNKNDFVRLSIGTGSACLSAANLGVYYPLASLVNECYIESCKHDSPPKIVADGGFKNYDEIIKNLSLGADYCMIGSIIAKSLDACGDVYWHGIKVTKIKYWMFNHGFRLMRKYRGMSTKEVQKSMGKTVLKTSEGISYWTPVEYKLHTWIENFEDYLRSAMSYSGTRSLVYKPEEMRPVTKGFVGLQNFIHISEQAIKRYKK